MIKVEGTTPGETPQDYVQAQIEAGRRVEGSQASLDAIEVNSRQKTSAAIADIQESTLQAKAEEIRTQHAEALRFLSSDGYIPLEDAVKHIQHIPNSAFAVMRVNDEHTRTYIQYRPGGQEPGRSSDDERIEWNDKREVGVRFADKKLLAEVEFLLSLDPAVRTELGIGDSTRSFNNEAGKEEARQKQHGRGYYHRDSVEDRNQTFYVCGDVSEFTACSSAGLVNRSEQRRLEAYSRDRSKPDAPVEFGALPSIDGWARTPESR